MENHSDEKIDWSEISFAKPLGFSNLFALEGISNIYKNGDIVRGSFDSMAFTGLGRFAITRWDAESAACLISIPGKAFKTLNPEIRDALVARRWKEMSHSDGYPDQYLYIGFTIDVPFELMAQELSEALQLLKMLAMLVGDSSMDELLDSL